MGLYEGYVASLGVLGSALAITKALQFPDWIRSRRDDTLEYVLGARGTQQLKRTISAQTGTSKRDIHFRVLNENTGSTSARGGFNLTYQVLLNEVEWMRLYWKQDRAAIDGTIRTHRQAGDHRLLSEVTEAELSAFTQQYLRAREGFEFVPQVYATIPHCGNLSEGIEGKTLASILSSQSPIHKRRDYFIQILDRATLITEELSQNERMKNIVKTARGNENTLGRAYKTRSYLRNKGITPIVASVLGVGEDTDVVIQRDLHPGNIIESEQQGMCFIDLSVEMGRWYDQAYALQHELGLVGDRETEDKINQELTKGRGSIEEKTKGKLRYHLTQLMRTEKHGQHVRAPSLRLGLDRYAAYHAHRIQELLPEAKLEEDLKKPLEELAQIIMSDFKVESLVEDYAEYLGSNHPFEKVSRETQSTSLSLPEYQQRIRDMRQQITKDLHISRLSAFTAGIFGSISPLVDPSLLESRQYYGTMAALATMYILTEAFTRLQQRDPSKILNSMGNIV